MGVVLFTLEFGIDMAISSSVITILMSLVGFTMVFKMCRPLNKMRVALMIAIIVLFILALVIMPEFFAMVVPNYAGWLIFSVFALLIPSVIYSLSKAFDNMPDMLVAAMEKMLDGITLRGVESLIASIDIYNKEDTLDQRQRDKIDAARADDMNSRFEDVVVNDAAEGRFL